MKRLRRLSLLLGPLMVVLMLANIFAGITPVDAARSTGSSIGKATGVRSAASCPTDATAIVSMSVRITRGGNTINASNLSNVQPGDTVKVTFDLNDACSNYRVSLVSYKAPDDTNNLDSLAQRVINSQQSMTFGSAGGSLTVTVPNCYHATVFAVGTVISGMSPAATYGSRQKDTKNGGTTACSGIGAPSPFFYVEGNQNCAYLGSLYGETWAEYKIDAIPTNGTRTIASGGYTVTVSNSNNKNTFSWASAGTAMKGVFVKASTGGNLYRYGSGSFSGTDLKSVGKADGQMYDISHVSFCFAPIPTTAVCPAGKAAVTAYRFEIWRGATKVNATDLNGVQSGDVVKAFFDLAPGCANIPLAMASYETVENFYNINTVDQQRYISSPGDEGLFSAAQSSSQRMLQTVVPNCYFQIDFVYGPVIENLTPDNLYGNNKFAWKNGGNPQCAWTITPTATFTPNATQTKISEQTATKISQQTGTAVSKTQTAIAPPTQTAVSKTQTAVAITATSVSKTQTVVANQTGTSVAKTATVGAQQTGTSVVSTQTVVAQQTGTSVSLTSTVAAIQTATSGAVTATSVSKTSTAAANQTGTTVASTATTVANQTGTSVAMTSTAQPGTTQTAIAIITKTAGPGATQTAIANVTKTSVAGSQTAVASTATYVAGVTQTAISNTATTVANQTGTAVSVSQTSVANTQTAVASTATHIAVVTETAVAAVTETWEAQMTQTSVVEETQTAVAGVTETYVAGVTETSVSQTETVVANQTNTAVALTETAEAGETATAAVATGTADAIQTQTAIANLPGTLKIHKRVTGTGLALFGACFEISGPGGFYLMDVCDNDGNDDNNVEGDLDFVGVLPGIYTVTESIAPDGYVGDFTDKTVTVPGGGVGEVTIFNSPITTPSGTQVFLYKINCEVGFIAPLDLAYQVAHDNVPAECDLAPAGVKFDIKDSDGNVIHSQITTDEYGMVSFFVLESSPTITVYEYPDTNPLAQNPTGEFHFGDVFCPCGSSDIVVINDAIAQP